MRKVVLALMSCLLLLSSCGTYTGEGATTGAAFGSILGSAIGGISGGWRGSDIGSIVGMAGGAVVGAAIGAAADQKVADRRAEWEQEQSRYDRQPSYGYGDDRIDFDAPGPTSRPATPTIKDCPPLEIRNACIMDADHDGVLRRGEECQVSFEIMNRTEKTLYDIQPMVFDISGNKHIQISPNLHVESIAPHNGIRYTASILADRRLKDGVAVIRIAVTLSNKEIASETQEFTLQTRKR